MAEDDFLVFVLDDRVSAIPLDLVERFDFGIAEDSGDAQARVAGVVFRSSLGEDGFFGGTMSGIGFWRRHETITGINHNLIQVKTAQLTNPATDRKKHFASAVNQPANAHVMGY